MATLSNDSNNVDDEEGVRHRWYIYYVGQFPPASALTVTDIDNKFVIL